MQQPQPLRLNAPTAPVFQFSNGPRNMSSGLVVGGNGPMTPTPSQRGGSFNNANNNNNNNMMMMTQQQQDHADIKAKLGIQDHYDKASSVCGHIDDLVAALTELYEENAKWKQKYISTKKAHFSKFFGASSTMLLGTTFREWKAWTFEQNAGRKMDGLMADHEMTQRDMALKLERFEDEHERRKGLKELEEQHKAAIQELSEQINSRNQTINKLQKEKDGAVKKAEKNYKCLHSLKGQLDMLNDEIEPPHEIEERQYPPHSFDFLKNKLHDLLNQVDPKYVPPLGSLSLMPPPGPLGSSSYSSNGNGTLGNGSVVMGNGHSMGAPVPKLTVGGMNM